MNRLCQREWSTFGPALGDLLGVPGLWLHGLCGPVAHIAYFNAEFVRRRKWLDQESYAHNVALCQLLPNCTAE